MRILAIETSCDETAIAIADFTGKKTSPRISVLSNIISSQIEIHKKFGGVVPSLARREHEKNLVPLLETAFAQADLDTGKTKKFLSSDRVIINSIEKLLEREPELFRQLKKKILFYPEPPIDAIAVTYGPGLAPALWVGVNFAKALAYLWRKPLYPINHMAGHFYSALIPPVSSIKYQVSRKNKTLNTKYLIINTIRFPVLALLVSGGHTELVLSKGHGKFQIIGETLDDAAGEAFDKVARLLGLGYPGGPAIAQLAKKGNPDAFKFPSPMINSKDHNFSFSGLKTAVFYHLRNAVSLASRAREAKLTADTAASFQKAVVSVLVKKTVRAAKEYRIKTVLLGGGVAANKKLREDLTNALTHEIPSAQCLMPNASLTGDNALMIALAAFLAGKKKAPTKVGADANLRLS